MIVIFASVFCKIFAGPCKLFCFVFFYSRFKKEIVFKIILVLFLKNNIKAQDKFMSAKLKKNICYPQPIENIKIHVQTVSCGITL